MYRFLDSPKPNKHNERKNRGKKSVRSAAKIFSVYHFLGFSNPNKDNERKNRGKKKHHNNNFSGWKPRNYTIRLHRWASPYPKICNLLSFCSVLVFDLSNVSHHRFVGLASKRWEEKLHTVASDLQRLVVQTRIGVSKQKTWEHPEAEGEREETLHCSCTRLELGVTEQLGGLGTPHKEKEYWSQQNSNQRTWCDIRNFKCDFFYQVEVTEINGYCRLVMRSLET